MEGLPFFEFVLVSSWLIYLWETYLDWRQYSKLCEKDRPKAIVEIVTEEKFQQAQAYGRDKAVFGFFKGMVSQVETTLFLVLGAYPYLWSAAESLALQLGYTPDHEIVVSLCFSAIQYVYSLVTSTPFSLYSTFVIEQRHGFNKMTFSLYVQDTIKSLGLSVLFGVPLLSGFIWIIRWGGEHFYIYVWAFVFAVQMLGITIYPVYIQPCFNEVKPLPEGPLRSAIEELAQQISFPLKKLMQIDGSKRSGHSNAYFYGFCDNKHIVLFDTLIDQSTQDEVVAVLGHELGHWKMMHMPKMIVIIQLRLFLQFFLFGQVINNPDMYSSFGMAVHPVIMGFTFFSMLLGPLDTVLNFLSTLVTRMHEFQADRYAAGLGKAQDLKSGLIKLQIENLGNMNPDYWYSTWHYSHPPMVERLQAIDACVATLGKKKE